MASKEIPPHSKASSRDKAKKKELFSCYGKVLSSAVPTDRLGSPQVSLQ